MRPFLSLVAPLIWSPCFAISLRAAPFVGTLDSRPQHTPCTQRHALGDPRVTLKAIVVVLLSLFSWKIFFPFAAVDVSTKRRREKG